MSERIDKIFGKGNRYGMKTLAAAYFDLVKPKIIFMVLITTSIGFLLSSQALQYPPANLLSMFLFTLLGTACTCGGGGVLNHYLERDIDCLMNRTSKRPIPMGLISAAEALGFGLALVLFGTVILVWKVNLLTGFLALLTAFLYVLVYTPLKRVTWLNTFIGAIPGALPPMGGWAAASGELGWGAWAMFAILFVWQHPHFYAIAWMYKEDYRRGGFKMLPVVDDEFGTRTFRQVIIYSILLIPVSLTPALIGVSGFVYFFGALTLGLAMLASGVVLSISRSVPDARKLVTTSIIYLPGLFFLVALDFGIGVFVGL